MPKLAAIDNDFLSHLMNIKDHEDVYELIVRFFSALDLKVIMHPLLRLHEKNLSLIFSKTDCLAKGL